MKRALSPSTNATGLGSAAAAIYAVVVMIVNATHHHGVIDPQVIVAALAAGAFLYSRMKVTPVADPKDGNGVPLVAGPPPPPPWDGLTGPATRVQPPATTAEKTLQPPPGAGM
jgi:hypothetical protein